MSSPPHPVSSPLRRISKKVESDHHTPPTSGQTELQKHPSKELGDNTWQFDGKRIAQMLSANGKGPNETIVNSVYIQLSKALGLDGKRSPGWPKTGLEQDWYTHLATFLNGCVDACRGPIGNRFYGDLKFIVYNRITEDAAEGAAALKPDLVGGLGLIPGEKVAWSPRSPSTKQVLLPVEVKEDWAPIVHQAATYARCLFSTSPSRHFVVVLGFRYTTNQLRFLVFHRGGLTGSLPFSVEAEGPKDILRVFLSILAWESAEDAGFLGFYNGSEMSLLHHPNDETGVVAIVKEVLHDDLSVQGRASGVVLLDYPTGGRKEPESGPSLSPPAPTVRTSGHLQEKAQTKQAAAETRMLFCH